MIKGAYNLACHLTKQVLLGKITVETAHSVFGNSGMVFTMKEKDRRAIYEAFEILLASAEMPELSERFTPGIWLPNPKVERGESFVVIDGCFARTTIMKQARTNLCQ